MATVSERNKLPLAAQSISSDTPFFWMGDTAWLLMQQCSREEAFLYLKNRKEKGFNVMDATTKEYWDHCVEIVEMAQELGLYMALLPTWGSIVKAGISEET